MIRMEIDRRDTFKLARLARKFPKETYKGVGRAGAVMRGKLRKVMRSGGGIEGVPTFEPLDQVTMQERRAQGSRVRKIGGMLSKAAAIQMYREGKGGFVVGFITALQAYARMLQEAESRPMTKGEKLRFFRLGINARQYTRPAREILEPFSHGAGREMARLAISLTQKILAGAK